MKKNGDLCITRYYKESMSRKCANSLVWPALILVIVICGCGKRDEQGTSQPYNYPDWYAEKFSFQIRPPDGWKPKKESNGVAFFGPTKSRSVFKKLAGLENELSVRIVGTDMTFEKIQKECEDVDKITKRTSNRKVGDFGGYQAVYTSFDGRLTGESALAPKELSIRDVDFLVNDAWYRASYEGETALIREHLPEAIHSIATLAPYTKSEQKPKREVDESEVLIRSSRIALYWGEEEMARTLVRRALAQNPTNAELLQMKDTLRISDEK